MAELLHFEITDPNRRKDVLKALDAHPVSRERGSVTNTDVYVPTDQIFTREHVLRLLGKGSSAESCGLVYRDSQAIPDRSGED